MLNITLPDGSQRQYPGPVTVAEVAASIGAGLAKAALGGRVEGQLVDTSFTITQDARLAIVTAKDADISVKFKPVSGKDDQAAGIVWRYADKNNYYIVRANALEDNVVLYIVKNGSRVDLPLKGKGKTYGAKVPPIVPR